MAVRTTRSTARQPLRAREHLDKAALGLAFLVGVAGTVVLKLSGVAPLWTAGWSVAVLLLYVLATLVAGQLTIEPESIGDNCYYLGFLLTLTSLAVTLYQLTESTEQTAALREIVSGFGIALASTIAGVFLRVLRRELGSVVGAAGGKIDPDGALVFPDIVLFGVGSAAITPDLRAFLERVCLPWFRTLESSGTAISELRIEGHASSEWETGTQPEAAYLHNLALSQSRAHAVLSTCLELVPGPEGAWARARATAVGYSSSHPVLADGREDAMKSRRVVFRVDFSGDRVLEEIEGDVAEGESGGAPNRGKAGADGPI